MWLIIIIVLWLLTSLSGVEIDRQNQAAKGEAILKKIRKDKRKRKWSGQGGRTITKIKPNVTRHNSRRSKAI